MVKYPQTPTTEDGDENATLNLREFFVQGQWKFFQARALYSNTEYGEDLIIRMQENGQITPVSFYVQSKTFNTPKRTKGKSLKADISLSTINYLLGLNLPILLHYYDIVHKAGYWIWLQEWHTKNYSPEWENQETVSVSIPKSYLLDENAVKTIKEYVNQHHRIYSSMEKARLVSQHNPDFSIKVERSDNGIHFSFSPKHPNAQLNIATDAEGFNLIKHNDETGEKVAFLGKVTVNNIFDQFFEKIFGDKSQIVITSTYEQEMLLQFQFLDADNNILVNVPLVRMKTVQFGKKVAILEGSYNHVKFRIKSDSLNKDISLNFSFSIVVEDLIGVAKAVELFEKIIKSRKTIIHNLDKPEAPIVWDNADNPVIVMPISEPEIRLIKALATIQSKSNVVIQFPKIFNDALLYILEGIAEGLQYGKTKHLVGLVSNEMFLNRSTSNPQKQLEDLGNGNNVSAKIAVPSEYSIFTIIDKEIDLGQLYIEFEQAKILNFSEIQAMLMNAKEGEEIEFVIQVEIDRANAQMIFADWPKREKFEAALSQVADIEPIAGDEL